MKTSLIIISLMVITLAAGTVIHLTGKKSPPVPQQVAEPASDTPPEQAVVPNEEPMETSPQKPDEPAQVSLAIQVPNDAAPDGAANAAPRPTPFSKAIDTVVSPQAGFEQKYEAWRQLQEAGQLDQVIEALKQGAAQNPTSAAYLAALGQAQLYKAGEVAQNGGSINEMGILGMQADQSFDSALKLDPANWEAQFFKAAAMSHWPLELNKGEEVIQRLSNLIDQQGTLSPQPQHAQTYVLLGDQYQKMGQSDYAVASWQIGAKKFPAHRELQRRIRGN